ncbi:MAG: hypothetical protein JWP40_2456 [Blastococcus sp.]|nr:hypothetical protein [Blastococcus sp.]
MSTVDTSDSHNWFVRAAAVIGDLSNPFYAEERQRDVWNEASAVALQVLIWLQLLAATAAVWIAGATAVPYVSALIGMAGVAGWVAVLYSWSQGVAVQKCPRTSWRRMGPLLGVVGLLAAGLVRAELAHASVDGWSTVSGVATGIVVTAALLTGLSRYARRRIGADSEG